MYLDKTLDVVVIDQWDQPLKEWGQQKFGTNRLSCYVQSEVRIEGWSPCHTAIEYS